MLIPSGSALYTTIFYMKLLVSVQYHQEAPPCTLIIVKNKCLNTIRYFFSTDIHGTNCRYNLQCYIMRASVKMKNGRQYFLYIMNSWPQKNMLADFLFYNYHTICLNTISYLFSSDMHETNCKHNLQSYQYVMCASIKMRMVDSQQSKLTIEDCLSPFVLKMLGQRTYQFSYYKVTTHA